MKLTTAWRRNKTPIRVLLVGDHDLIRACLRSLLEKLEETQVVAEVSDAAEVIRLAQRYKPHVVLTDIAFLTGLEVTRVLAKKLPDVRVLILSEHSDEEHVYPYLRAGAAGYLLKGAEGEELGRAISALANGKTYLSPDVSTFTFVSDSGVVRARRDPLNKLSLRQSQILQLIAEGKTTKQMALQLNINVKTVETHRTHLMARLAIHNVASLVRFAIKAGLVGIED